MDTPTILFVDDTPTNLDLVKAILEAEGFHALTASDGPSARNLIRARQPDLILLDVMMPGEFGFETCARLKSDPVTADIPIIFLSALDDVKSKVTGLKIGAVDYVAKPLYGEELLARVRIHLRIRETNRALVKEQASGSGARPVPPARSFTVSRSCSKSCWVTLIATASACWARTFPMTPCPGPAAACSVRSRFRAG